MAARGGEGNLVDAEWRGLELGWDHTVYCQLKTRWQKAEQYSLLGTFEVGMAAGYWPLTRHREAGYMSCAKCPRCGLED